MSVEAITVLDGSNPKCMSYVGWPPLMEWIREHGANPGNVKKLEILVIDVPLVRFHEYDLDGENRLWAKEDNTVAMKPPRDVLMRRPLPEHPDMPLKEI